MKTKTLFKFLLVCLYLCLQYNGYTKCVASEVLNRELTRKTEMNAFFSVLKRSIPGIETAFITDEPPSCTSKMI